MKKTPLITIIGVPNTGKSTLFNRLIGERKALIHSHPGMTRDIFRKTFEINQNRYHIQDSGGFFLDKNNITKEINKKIIEEAENSDLIIFLFDGKRELLGYEKDLFLNLRRINQNIIPVVNKVDNTQTYLLPNSYYFLKLDYIMISAEHNLGIDELLDAIESKLGNLLTSKKSPSLPETRISIVGKPNVGKSSLVNSLLKKDCVIVSPFPGTTRDSVDLEIKINNKKFILVDNAGIRKLSKVKEDTESAAVIRAEKNIKKADLVIFMLDLSKKIEQNDLFIAKKILSHAKPTIIAANKCDLIRNQDKDQNILSKIKQRFNFFYFAPFILTSVKTGKNIHKIITRIEEIERVLTNKIKTSTLNLVIRNILKEKKMIMTNNKIFNPKYSIVESYNPFFIRFFVKTKSRLKPHVELYLKKRLIKELGIEGIPIFFNISSRSQ